MKALILFSGGVDSTTCLAMAIKQYGKEEVLCLSISYGQKHEKELNAAKSIINYYGVNHVSIDLASIFSMSDCSLLTHSQQEIPKDSYENQLKLTKGNPVSTYVPFRNGLFLSAAASIALSYQCEFIYYGAHKDDAAGNAYPDCSTDFFQSISTAIYEGSGSKITVKAPFINWNKAQIIGKGLSLKVPYELTWSCYYGLEKPCGTCGTCIDREKAFRDNQVVDPLFGWEEN